MDVLLLTFLSLISPGFNQLLTSVEQDDASRYVETEVHDLKDYHKQVIQRLKLLEKRKISVKDNFELDERNVDDLQQRLERLEGRMGKIQIKGQKGAQGFGGSSGYPGASGSKGSSGTDGITGRNGLKGDQGTFGNPGTKGTKGPKGLRGDGGIGGNLGYRGAKGAKGYKGYRGYTGSKGTTGSKGATVNGQAGDPGSRGATGDRGPRTYGSGCNCSECFRSELTFLIPDCCSRTLCPAP